MLSSVVLVVLSADFAIPYPWLEHCAANPQANCEVETISLADVAKLNKVINDAITPAPDAAGDDRWEAFPSDRTGDCEDYALTKRQALRSLGFKGPMTVILGRAVVDGAEQDHVVLEVEIDGRAWVMDNLAADYLYAPGDEPYEWSVTARQPHASATWIIP